MPGKWRDKGSDPADRRGERKLSQEAKLAETGRKAERVRIKGRVQGVGFRIWTRTEAERLGITGWVRNEKDGSVAAFLEGSDEAVSAMLEALWSGPPGAVVGNVVSEAAEPIEQPAGFRIVR